MSIYTNDRLFTYVIAVLILIFCLPFILGDYEMYHGPQPSNECVSELETIEEPTIEEYWSLPYEDPAFLDFQPHNLEI